MKRQHVAPRGGRRLRCAFGILAFAALLGCGPRAPAPTVSMRMNGTPPNATVTIDDVFVGTLDVVMKRGVALPRGRHRISVEAPGYLPWDRMVDAKEGLVRLDVQLVAIPD